MSSRFLTLQSPPARGETEIDTGLNRLPGDREKKIKILFLIDILFWKGGTENHLTEIVTNLDRKRFECTVCALNRLNEEAQPVRRMREEGIPYKFGRVHRAYDPNGIWQALRLARFIRKEQFDIVQTFHFVSDTYGVAAAKLGGAPIIVSSRRDMDSYNGGIRRLARRFTNPYIDHFIAVCDAVRSNVGNKERVPLEKITTVYNGVDLSKFKLVEPQRRKSIRTAMGIHPAAFVIGNISAFRPEKDHPTFFAAIKKIAPEIPHLKVFAIGLGHPSYEEFQRQCAADDSLRDAVIFTGGVEDVRDYINAMDVACLCPSKNEGLSNSILEEMALGKPVVATDVGGNAELVVTGETGIIVPPGDADRLAGAFLYLYQNPELRAAMGNRARERVEMHFDLRRMILNMETFYENLYRSKGLCTNQM